MAATGDAKPGKGGQTHDAWAVVLPDGGTKLVRDLPFDLLSEVAVGEGIDDLSALVDDPLRRGEAAQKLYRATVRALELKPEPTDTARQLRARFRLVEAPMPSDAFWDLYLATWAELEDEAGRADPDAVLVRFSEESARHQWAVVLPDSTVVALCDLQWALLEIVGRRHGLTLEDVEQFPRKGDGRLTADLWRSITENQRQDATTDGMSYAEVMARFTLVPNDKPEIPVEPTGGPEPAPEPAGPETD